MATAKNQHSTKNNKDIDNLIHDLVDELGNLRITQKEIMSRFQSNQDAKIVWCLNSLSVKDSDDRPTILEKKKVLQELLKGVQELKLKPNKGRLKDLRRINDLISLLYSKLLD